MIHGAGADLATTRARPVRVDPDHHPGRPERSDVEQGRKTMAKSHLSRISCDKSADAAETIVNNVREAA